jgi:hypothetical protein
MDWSERRTRHRKYRMALFLSGQFEELARVFVLPTWRHEMRGQPCTYCGKLARRSRARTIDHVVPRAHGGAASVDNEVPACAACNQEKSDRGVLTFLIARREKRRET